jgi:hypothetical protein
MSRFAWIPICVCLAAPLVSGCQSASPRTASTAGSRPSGFWSADGKTTQTTVATGRGGSTPFRLTSTKGRDDAVTRTAGGRAERIPLPRTDVGGLRDVDGSAPARSIGAF